MLDYSINQQRKWVFLVAQELKNFLEMQETWVQSLGWEVPLEENMATHFSVLAWRIPMDRGSWLATVHGWGHKDLDTTDQLSTHFYIKWLSARLWLGRKTEAGRRLYLCQSPCVQIPENQALLLHRTAKVSPFLSKSKHCNAQKVRRN